MFVFTRLNRLKAPPHMRAFFNALGCSQVLPGSHMLPFPRWLQMLPELVRSCQRVLEVSRCSQMFPDAASGSQMFSGATTCCQMFQEVHSCSPMSRGFSAQFGRERLLNSLHCTAVLENITQAARF